jgi:hypothetical protein
VQGQKLRKKLLDQAEEGKAREEKSKRRSSTDENTYGETGNRTQNLLHLTSAVTHDAKKMSYH